MEKWTHSKLGKEYTGCILSPCLFNFYAEFFFVFLFVCLFLLSLKRTPVVFFLAKLLQLCPTLQACGPQPARLLCPWDSPGENTGGGRHALLQGSFPTQGSNPCLQHLLHRQEDSLPGAPPGLSGLHKVGLRGSQESRLFRNDWSEFQPVCIECFSLVYDRPFFSIFSLLQGYSGVLGPQVLSVFLCCTYSLSKNSANHTETFFVSWPFNTMITSYLRHFNVWNNSVWLKALCSPRIITSQGFYIRLPDILNTHPICC